MLAVPGWVNVRHMDCSFLTSTQLETPFVEDILFVMRFIHDIELQSNPFTAKTLKVAIIVWHKLPMALPWLGIIYILVLTT